MSIPHQRRGYFLFWCEFCGFLHKHVFSQQALCCFQATDDPRWFGPGSWSWKKNTWTHQRLRVPFDFILSHDEKATVPGSLEVCWIKVAVSLFSTELFVQAEQETVHPPYQWHLHLHQPHLLKNNMYSLHNMREVMQGTSYSSKREMKCLTQYCLHIICIIESHIALKWQLHNIS